MERLIKRTKLKSLKLFVVTLFLFVTLFAAAKPQFGNALLFNDGWKFNLSDVKDGANPTFNDSRWNTVRLPHDWSVKGILSPDRASCQGYLPGGIGWYRKTFIAPSAEKVFIYFEGVYNHSEVFLNGKSLGIRPSGYVSFLYDLTPYLKMNEPNVLAVRVDHSEDADSRWYTGSGIYRNVWLVTSGKVHLDLWGVFFKATNVTEKKADVSVESTICNESTQTSVLSVLNEIVDPITGKVVAGSTKKVIIPANSKQAVAQNLTVKSPKRWSIEQPNLYRVRTSISVNGQVIERNEQEMGIRSLTFDPNKGFALNDHWMKIKGVCMHHDAGVLGSAVPREVWKRRLLTLKDMGCNAVRMSHNPQSPDVYELCDEIGLLVMDEAFDEWEFAKKKWIAGWNKGTPKFQGAFSYFNEWSDRDLRDMVLRDRNHASIFLWSIGNEVDYPNDPYSHPVLNGSTINQPVQGGYLPNNPKAERLGAIAKRLAADVRALDTSRPTTAALAGVIMSNQTDYPFVLDVTGYNYTEDRYSMDHKTFPKRVIFGSENGHSMDSWKVVRDSSFIFGQFIWTGIDYLGESNAWPSRGFYSGFLDFGGFMKPRGHFRQALWCTNPVAYIGTYPISKNSRQNLLSTDAWPIWNYDEGQLIRVVCYTNASKAKLMLNGKEVGAMKDYDDTTGIIFWDIPYVAGKLEVVGFDKAGKMESKDAIQTSGRSSAITVSSDVSMISKEQGLAQIVVQVVDDKGIPVMLSDDELTCTIEGPAVLLGLEASNNSDMGDYSDNVQRVFHGRLIAYVQANGQEGEVKIHFRAPWLKEGVTKLTVR
ncbi:MAG TPA: glycoside hydrolase family 2 TIM barrel-domain containing protein [Bacteroidales bacterium]|nr:glycoside hydrolase family 2 TIM barrel-domain containing protein [Bacteroidales bacterium]